MANICQKCDGIGECFEIYTDFSEPCDACKGKGILPDYYKSCPYCKGEGKVRGEFNCLVCEGSGYVP